MGLRDRPAMISIFSACLCVSVKGCILIQPQQKLVGAFVCGVFVTHTLIFVTHTDYITSDMNTCVCDHAFNNNIWCWEWGSYREGFTEMETYKRGTKVVSSDSTQSQIIVGLSAIPLHWGSIRVTETRVMRRVKAAKAEVMRADWACGGSSRSTSAPDVTRKPDFKWLTMSRRLFQQFWSCCFSQITQKKLPQRPEGPNLSAPYSPPPLLFSIDFLHNRHFNWNTLFFNIHLQHNSNLSHIDCGWISTWCRVSLIHRHF